MYYALLIAALAAVLSGTSAKSVNSARARLDDVWKLARELRAMDQLTTLQATTSPASIDYFGRPKYQHNRTKIWMIEAAPAMSISVTYLVADIENSEYCHFDKLTLLDTETDASVKTCGTYDLQCIVIHTVGNKLMVLFESDSSVNGLGFSLLYHATPVRAYATLSLAPEGHGGRMYRSPGVSADAADLAGNSSDVATGAYVAAEGVCLTVYNGVITLADHGNHVYCHHTIRVPSDLVVVLVVDLADIETGDLLQIKEFGHTIGRPITNAINSPCTIVSRDSELSVTFIAGYDDKSDFRLLYYPARRGSVSTECPELGLKNEVVTLLRETHSHPMCEGLYNDKQELVSPNFPHGDYFNLLDCVWEFQVPADKLIVVTIHSLDIEDHDDCDYDSLSLSGACAESSLLCGEDKVSHCSLVFSGPTLSLHFHTDDSVGGSGFNVSLSAVPAGSDVTSTCFHEEELTYPANGGQYDNEAYEEWVRTVSPGEHIQVTVNNFDIEYESNCLFDSLTMTAPDGAGWRLCGSDMSLALGPCTITIPSDEVTLNFASDESETARGFSLVFTEVSPSAAPENSCLDTGINAVELRPPSAHCTEVVGDSGSLSVPPPDGLPEYRPNTDICYRITLPEDQLIAVKLVRADIEFSPDCLFDKLSITHGGETEDFCGEHYQNVIYTQGNVTVRFTTDASVQEAGWLIQYHTYTQGEPMPFSETDDASYSTPCAIPSSRIVGGSAAEQSSHPWIVSVLRDGNRVCGGTIVNAQAVITAAHCVEDIGPSDLRHLRILAGDHNISYYEGYEKTLPVDNILVYPDYISADVGYDVAILKLESSLMFSEHIRPVCIANVHPQHGTVCVASGWGDTVEDGTSSPAVLQEVSLPLLDSADCEKWSGGYLNVTDTMFCAGRREGGVDTCQGDSGGPLTCEIDGVDKLVGVTSWGRGCARENHPGVYAKIANQEIHDWIMMNI